MGINWKRLVGKSTARFHVENPSSKNFHDELEQFNLQLEKHINFSLVRFGDGEMIIINGEAIDLSQKYNGEHQYIPGDEQHEQQRELLRQSLNWQSPNYYVGIACPCCVGTPAFLSLKEQSKQPEKQLTKANVKELPFEVNETFRSGPNSWLNDHQRLLTEIGTYIESNNVSNEVFIFCAGVLSNILVYQLNKQFPNNTYLDVGSVFDSVMGLGKTRKYLKNGRTLRQTCVWV